MDNSPRPLEGKVYFSDYNNCKTYAFTEGEIIMNKKLLATLVATMAVGTTAFAANPFQDVPQDSWAYNSVVELQLRYHPGC